MVSFVCWAEGNCLAELLATNLRSSACICGSVWKNNRRWTQINADTLRDGLAITHQPTQPLSPPSISRRRCVIDWVLIRGRLISSIWRIFKHVCSMRDSTKSIIIKIFITLHLMKLIQWSIQQKTQVSSGASPTFYVDTTSTGRFAVFRRSGRILWIWKRDWKAVWGR